MFAIGSSAQAARRIAGLLLVAGLATAAALSSCSDSVAPPPPPVATDFTAHFIAATNNLSIDPPTSGEPLRFEVTGVVADPTQHTVVASVRIHNTSGSRRVGPEGVAIFELSPAGVTPGGDAICDPPDASLPELPADACLSSFLGSYDPDGMLDAGETSSVETWTFQNWAGGDFSFRVLALSTGFAAAGEIAGTVFSDDNGNGSRDPEESGIPSVGVTLQTPDSLAHAVTSPSGRFSFDVGASGNYTLSKPFACCTVGSNRYDVALRPRPGGGGLNGFSGDFSCTEKVPDFPLVAFLDVQRGGGLPPCSGAEPCSIPFGTPFRIRFTGAQSCNPLRGIQWQSLRPREVVTEPWQPYESETLFLAFGHADTAALRAPRDTVWSFHADVVTVHYPNVAFDTLSGGTLQLRARVRDSEGAVSLLAPGTRRVTINLDPQTAIQTRVACNCPLPPAGCAARGPVQQGWITGIDETEFAIADWIPFCPGDTLPNRSHVRFFASGHDDARDRPIDPVHGLQDAGFSFRFTSRGSGFVNENMPFSSEYQPADLPLPGGGTWHGGAVGWEACPFDYTFFAAAVDEHSKRDGTPDSLVFFGSGAPTIDSLVVPIVVVLAPTCPSGCPTPSGPAFGPDTLVVFGTYIPDTSPPLTPGANAFVLPIRAYGHDHPRDRNAPGRNWYTGEHEGRIHGWRYSFDCVGGGCDDLVPSGEDAWMLDVASPGDPAGQQVFDNEVTLTLPLVPCTSGCTPGTLVVDGTALGLYEISLRAQDNLLEPCFEPSDLGPNPVPFPRPSLGREAREIHRQIVVRQLSDVRQGPVAKSAPRSRRTASHQAMR